MNQVDIGSNPIQHPKLKMVSWQSGLMRCPAKTFVEKSAREFESLTYRQFYNVVFMLKSSFRTFVLQRRYDFEDILKLINPNTISKKTRCYVRVALNDQKKNLVTQFDKLKNYCIDNNIENFEVIQDLGSGLNYKKKDLNNF